LPQEITVNGFRNRRDAGRQLAARLMGLRDEHPVIVGLPRGGVPVAAEVASALGAPLDVIVVRKLGVPFQPELGMGAVGEGGVRVLNPSVIQAARIHDDEFAAVVARESDEVDRRARSLRGAHPMISLIGRTVVIVDDGLATGGTARAAIEVARAQGAARVVLAVPVAPAETMRELAEVADEVIVVLQPFPFGGVGRFYEDFTQTSDAEVLALLAAARHEVPAAPVELLIDDEVVVDTESIHLPGHLTVPIGAVGIVLFVHGSGSSRHSPRNRSVARALNQAGLGTLLFDLLTSPEAADRRNVFDIQLLAGRLGAATNWLRSRADLTGMRIGYFGASTGAAAALWAAGAPHATVDAIVSRGGRPDLAMGRLANVQAPTELIVGGADTEVLDLNRFAASELRVEHRIDIIPNATHLFEEPGALERVAELAAGWFTSHFARPPV
jgi:putative phosphoribosyl transferase